MLGAAFAAAGDGGDVRIGLGRPAVRHPVRAVPGHDPRLCLRHPQGRPGRLGHGDQYPRRRPGADSCAGVVQARRPDPRPERRKPLSPDRAAVRRHSGRRCRWSARSIPRYSAAIFIIVYFAFAAVPLAAWVVYRTRFGLRLRAVGESPEAVDTAGISVDRMRYQALLVTGLLCGIAGAYLSTAQTASFIRDMSAGQGFIALAALIFGKWRPYPTMLACLLFALADALQVAASGRRHSRHRHHPGPVHPGPALRPHGHRAGGVRRQGRGAAGERHPLHQGALRTWPPSTT